MKLLNGILLSTLMATSTIWTNASDLDRLLIGLSTLLMYILTVNWLEEQRVEKAKERMWRRKVERRKADIDGVTFIDLDAD